MIWLLRNLTKLVATDKIQFITATGADIYITKKSNFRYCKKGTADKTWQRRGWRRRRTASCPLAILLDCLQSSMLLDELIDEGRSLTVPQLRLGYSNVIKQRLHVLVQTIQLSEKTRKISKINSLGLKQHRSDNNK